MYLSAAMSLKPDVIPRRLQECVHFVSRPGLTRTKQILQLIDFAPFFALFVGPRLVPQVSNGVPDISVKCRVSKPLFGNVPDHALDEIGAEGFCRLIPRINHLVPQSLQNS